MARKDYSTTLDLLVKRSTPADLAACARVCKLLVEIDQAAGWNLTAKGLADRLAGAVRFAERVEEEIARRSAPKGKG